MLRGALIAVAAALGAGAASAEASLSPDGRPGSCARFATQLGCLRLTPPPDADSYATQVVASPDGRMVVKLSGGAPRSRGKVRSRSLLHVLRRDAATGRLRQVQCISAVRRRRCVTARGIDGAWDVVFSRDGRFAYVGAVDSRGVAIFRVRGGRLVQLAGRAGCVRGRPRRKASERCTFLRRPLQIVDSVRLTPDGRLLYAGLHVLRRDTRTGRLRPAERHLPSTDGRPFDRILDLDGHGAYVFTPDGRFAYQYDGRLLGYRISRATGRLAPIGRYPFRRFAVAPDGRTGVAVDGRALRVLAIDQATGVLRPAMPAVPVCEPIEREQEVCGSVAEPSVYDLEITPDGRAVVLTLSQAVVVVRRDPATGALSAPAAGDCVSASAKAGAPCAAAPGLSALGATLLPRGEGVLVDTEVGIDALRLDAM